jgi:hypothetical protein
MAKIEVGQKLVVYEWNPWEKPPAYKRSEVTVTKVGRKWAEVDSIWFGKLDIERMHFKDSYPARSVYLNDEEFRRERLFEESIKILHQEFDHYGPYYKGKFRLEQLLGVIRALGLPEPTVGETSYEAL